MQNIAFSNELDTDAQWAIVWLWSHQMLAGTVDRVDVFGKIMVKIVVPDYDSNVSCGHSHTGKFKDEVFTKDPTP